MFENEETYLCLESLLLVWSQTYLGLASEELLPTSWNKTFHGSPAAGKSYNKQKTVKTWVKKKKEREKKKRKKENILKYFITPIFLEEEEDG